MLYKLKVLNFIKTILSKIKSLIKFLIKLVIKIFIIKFLVSAAILLYSGKWNLIIYLFLDNIYTIWEHVPRWENLENLFSNNKVNDTVKTPVFSDVKLVKKFLWITIPDLNEGEQLYLFFLVTWLLWWLIGQ